MSIDWQDRSRVEDATSSLATTEKLAFSELLDRWCLPGEVSIWRAGGLGKYQLPSQGYKLHLSADVRHARRLLEIVAPLLCEAGIHFKVIRSLEDLARLNIGLFGFSQIGKCITVYPADVGLAQEWAERLSVATHGVRGPAVPSDRRFCQGSPVYFRYGRFGPNPNGEDEAGGVDHVIDPHGVPWLDLRRPGEAVPPWVEEQLMAPENEQRSVARLLERGLLVFGALSQRGKGGVYAAVDLRRSCHVILKEGRRDGETDWRGQDGRDRLEREVKINALLTRAGFPVPAILETLELDNDFYAVLELVDGVPLERFLTDAKRKLPVRVALSLGWQIARFLSGIHELGWVWRDCKPMNIIVGREGRVVFIDFEGAALIDETDLLPFGTAAYMPPESLESMPRDLIQLDLHALGVTLYQVISGQAPGVDAIPAPIGRRRKGVPTAVRDLIGDLVAPRGRGRPSAAVAAKILRDHL